MKQLIEMMLYGISGYEVVSTGKMLSFYFFSYNIVVSRIFMVQSG